MDTEETIKRVRTGDTTALSMLIQTYSPIVRKVCFNITNEDEDILNDLVQVVFIRAYYSLNQLRDDSKFGEWVCAIAKNEALKFLKNKQKGRLIPFSAFTNEELEVEWNITPENWLEEKEIKEIISQLPAGYGKVFQMAVIEGYSHKEIAEKLGIEPHSSSSQLARAKAMLRKMINKRMLAAISIIFISIPLYRIILRMYKTEDENTHTAQIKDEGKGQPKVAKKQTEEKPVQTNGTKDPTASKSHTDFAPTTSDSIPEVDTLQILDTPDNSHIALSESDSIVADSTRAPKHEYDKPYIAEENRLPEKQKWQLIATGSLGTASDQSANKMLAGNIGSSGPDIDAPVAPSEFTTWDELYRHLQQKEQEGLSEEEKALMEIALNNKNNISNIKNDGKIVEHEHHDKPITFGLSATMSLGNNWNVATGLQYSFLKSDFTSGEDGYYIKRNQKIHYLGIPLQVSYRWFETKKWSVYSSLGGTLHIPVYGNTSERYVVGQSTPYTANRHITPPLQWSVGTSIGVQYQFAPNWGIYLEPSLNWYIPNSSSVHTVWTEHPVTFTVPFGIRFTW